MTDANQSDAVVGTNQQDQSGWLIEESGGGFTHYIALTNSEWPRTKTTTRRARMNRDFDVETTAYRSPVIRTKDAGEALRFARKEDAEAVIRLFSNFLLHPVATEHMWPSGQPKLTNQQDTALLPVEHWERMIREAAEAEAERENEAEGHCGSYGTSTWKDYEKDVRKDFEDIGRAFAALASGAGDEG